MCGQCVYFISLTSSALPASTPNLLSSPKAHQ